MEHKFKIPKRFKHPDETETKLAKKCFSNIDDKHPFRVLQNFDEAKLIGRVKSITETDGDIRSNIEVMPGKKAAFRKPYIEGIAYEPLEEETNGKITYVKKAKLIALSIINR